MVTPLVTLLQHYSIQNKWPLTFMFHELLKRLSSMLRIAKPHFL